ncbi:unnamed protein product [Vitrella brassicaformis CCMP3155]|uniref:Uncharacterized protein n=2 Tax=Vitrella brassicaformis TaxID=1169539 RepID=A0A0G4GVZ8_VITBC|nr:unnamed protein product [Vitrella brassicaformis CCMP3155]|eukprot:CEM34859.1 unnamed protein product [Vitrella brassicaformis CCMP3155]
MASAELREAMSRLSHRNATRYESKPKEGNSDFSFYRQGPSPTDASCQSQPTVASSTDGCEVDEAPTVAATGFVRERAASIESASAHPKDKGRQQQQQQQEQEQEDKRAPRPATASVDGCGEKDEKMEGQGKTDIQGGEKKVELAWTSTIVLFSLASSVANPLPKTVERLSFHGRVEKRAYLYSLQDAVSSAKENWLQAERDELVYLLSKTDMTIEAFNQRVRDAVEKSGSNEGSSREVLDAQRDAILKTYYEKGFE